MSESILTNDLRSGSIAVGLGNVWEQGKPEAKKHSKTAMNPVYPARLLSMISYH